MKRWTAARNRTQDTWLVQSVLCTELRQPDNHQPSLYTAQMGLKCLSRTPGTHLACNSELILVYESQSQLIVFCLYAVFDAILEDVAGETTSASFRFITSIMSDEVELLLVCI